MSETHSLALIVPCYNEAQRFSYDVYKGYLDSHPEISLIFVDDGSTDDTLKKLLEFSRDMVSQAQVITMEVNSGKAEAIRRGVLLAIEDYTYIGYWDADLSTPLDEVNNLLDQINEAFSLIAYEVERLK